MSAMPTRPPILAVPIGSCEQHGPHLPLDTDTRVAVALAEALVQSFEPGEVIVAPPITVSASGEHAGFPGTLSFGNAVVESMIVELVRSADWSVGRRAGQRPRRQRNRSAARGRRRSTPNGDGCWRGGRTSPAPTRTPATPRRRCMLAIAPELVRLDRAERGRTEHITDLIDDLRASGVRAVSPNGVLGDPHGATRHTVDRC